MTVVVLSHDRPALLRKALASIAAQTYPRLEIIVIDNRSSSSAAIGDVVREFPSHRLVANEENLGFTGGMNQGLAEASGEYVYLTEDDVELEPGCVSLLVEHLEQHPEVGLVGPVMWNRNSRTIRCAGGRFDLGAIFRLRIVGENQAQLAERQPFETMFLPGSMIAARTALLRRLGGFHREFFMYYEDIELCARVLERGYTIAVVPTARVHHQEPADMAVDSQAVTFHKRKNLAAIYMLHAPARILPAFLLRYVVLDSVKWCFKEPSTIGPCLKAWRWCISRAPRLLAERRSRFTADRSAAVAKAAE